VDMLYSRWYGPREEPETNSESWAGCNERANLCLGADWATFLTVPRECLLVVDAGNDVYQ